MGCCLRCPLLSLDSYRMASVAMVATRPVLIRLPEVQVERLERACRAQSMTKQAFVSAAVATRLDDAGVVGSAVAPVSCDAVLTLDELAELLRVDIGAVRRRVEAGELPGRRFGDEWRFSLAGVLVWLATSEDHGRRAAGFEAPPAA